MHRRSLKTHQRWIRSLASLSCYWNTYPIRRFYLFFVIFSAPALESAKLNKRRSCDEIAPTVVHWLDVPLLATTNEDRTSKSFNAAYRRLLALSVRVRCRHYCYLFIVYDIVHNNDGAVLVIARLGIAVWPSVSVKRWNCLCCQPAHQI